MPAWNGWYHCVSSTYGTWLPGDPRGFRTRHHREHVEGDYKSPPPLGLHDARLRAAQQRLRQAPVVLEPAARHLVLQAVLHAWVTVHGIEVLAVGVATRHLHVLARFGRVARAGPADPPGQDQPRGSSCEPRQRDPARYHLGIAKQWSAKALVRQGLARPGRVWALRGKIVPIRDRAHQVTVFHYILRHAREGAAVWSFREPLPGCAP